MNFETPMIEITIKEARKSKGVSLSKLEFETGIERHYLSDIENGKIPADEILFSEMIMVAHALKCKITDLYEIKNLEIIDSNSKSWN